MNYRPRCQLALLLPVFLGLAYLAGFAPSASADPMNGRADAEGWILLPEQPELPQTFSADALRLQVSHLAECVAQMSAGAGLEIPRNPSASVLGCWSSYVSQAGRRAFGRQKPSSKADVHETLCVRDWVLDEAPNPESDRARCPFGKKGRSCARAGKSAKGSAKNQIDPEYVPLIDGDFKEMEALAEALALEYTAFDYLRRGHSENRFNSYLSQLTIGQGLIVLYSSHVILRYEDALADGGCGAGHVVTYMKMAREASGSVVNSLSSVFDSYPPAREKWHRQLYQLQLAALSSLSKIRSDSAWGLICEEAWAEGGEMDGFDADIYSWCAYSYKRVGNTRRSEQALERAVRSTNHPEMSSYASWALRDLPGR